jgi:hypothetical protein
MSADAIAHLAFLNGLAVATLPNASSATRTAIGQAILMSAVDALSREIGSESPRQAHGHSHVIEV